MRSPEPKGGGARIRLDYFDRLYKEISRKTVTCFGFRRAHSKRENCGRVGAGLESAGLESSKRTTFWAHELWALEHWAAGSTGR
jgi:hypothetical protein